jgi:NTP pyrophosphatase (non-canonical NTP hydrolase)
MNFDDYQRKAVGTAIYPNQGDNLYYPALGLAGEAGEVCDKIKKIMRDCDGTLTSEQEVEIIKELGDVLWYVANLCEELDYDMSEAAVRNITKLESRKMRGTLKGSGDNR